VASRSPVEPRGAPGGAWKSALATRRRIRHTLLLLAGLAILVAVFRSVGWREIAANVSRAGPWFLFVVVIYTLAQLSFALGWRTVIDPVPPLSRFPRLFGMYLSGDAANSLGPGSVAGEPLKVHLLRDATGAPAALASVTIHKHAELLSQWIFLSICVGVALARFSLPAAARVAALAATAGLGALLFLWSRALRQGTYSPVLRWLARWKPLVRRLERFHAPAAQVDGRISEFYAAHPGRFARSVAWCFAGWCGGLLETWILLRLLSPGAGWPAAFAIEGLAMTLNNAFLFIPGRVGSAEGIRVAVFLLVGLPAAQGGAYAVLRRGRELAWTIPGLLLLLFPRPVAAEAPEMPLASGGERG
jgi:uncharacterized protein (TIRG00374 family)